MVHVPTISADGGDALVVRRNPARMALKALGGAVILGVGLYMTRGGVTSHRFAPETVVALGWGAAAFGLAAIVLVGIAIARARPALIANRAGITLYSAFGRATALAWDDLAGWSVAQHKRESLLVLGLRDLDGYVRALSGVRQVMAIRRARDIGSPVAVALGDLLIDRDTLFGGLDRSFRTYAPTDRADGAAAAAAPSVS